MTTIRPMREGDLEAVVAMEAREQPHPWTEAMFRQELGESNRAYFVADDDGIVGFAGLMLIDDEGHINTLFVTEARRREGIGRELMRRLIRTAIESGALHLTLEVRARNEAARAFYARLGFVPVGLRPRYYGDDDALIMWVHDADEPAYLETIA